MDDAATVIRAYLDAFNRGDRAAMLDLLTDDVAHDVNQGGREIGRDAFAAFMARMDRCYRERLEDIVVMATPDGTRAAEEAELRATVHALPQHDPAVRTEVTAGLGRPPYGKTPAIQALYDHAAALAAECGLPSAGERVAGGGSDGNFTGALGVPTLDGLGAIGGGPHTREEHIELRCLVPRTRLLARLFETLGPGTAGL